MSVPKGERSESPIEYYHTATLARAEIARLCMNENIVPKRWRQVFTYPTIQKTIDMMDAIIAADSLKPRSEEEYILKIKWQTRAILVVEQTFQQLQFLIETLRPNVDKFKRVTELLMEELKLLKEWKLLTEQRFKNFQK